MSQNLDPRLALLFEMTPPCRVAADIGTDHGYLICSLVEQGRAEHGIAADISLPSLEKARREAARRGLGREKVSFCLTDGLEGIGPAVPDAVIIAGMGGETILHIMESWRCRSTPGITYLLQPMSKAERLRRWLWQEGFALRRERCCTAAGRVYSAMEAVYTGEAAEHPPWEQFLGGIDPGLDPDSRRYALRKSEELRKIAAGLRSTQKPADAVRADALEEAAAIILRKAGSP